MRAITTILLMGFLTNTFASYTDSFIVEITDRKIRVTSPPKEIKTVSVIIKNTTFDKIISELRSESKVLKKFVLKPEGKEVIQVDYSKVKSLYYVPIAPPFESVELRFEEKPYEIPEKKQ